ncbi:SbcC/MukB-like Walker B domain-containing protein [Sphaerisporangium sp. NPDC049003]|uniref:SbcC/MukB-like Walker B domain-containing protein n=1 Tax=Sphaerisporangium sp. NPDC049003 TaxID=3364517 RepID=UPI003722624D
MTPASGRFKPSRAGVINIWDYIDEEFVFADGRLVLRGHNGSGKTKALEVLFPFVLDGVSDARRLDPFSGENRTMKSNLLYRGQEAEYGYVWMEFTRDPADGNTDETGKGVSAAWDADHTDGRGGEAVTLIIGLRAHRHRDGVTPSFFVTGRRVGVDFGLLSADSRPLTEKQLKAVLEPGARHRTATEYRAAVDARLFGLGKERYAQLLDLLLALRRPLLAKDLDPVKVSDTLSAGLSPVDPVLVEQAARDFENLAAVQRLFEDLTLADGAVKEFLGHYTAYLRAHVRHHLDRIHERLDGAASCAARIARSASELRRARTAHAAATAGREAAEAELARYDGRLAVLKQHEAYKARGELDGLRRQIADDSAGIARERQRLDQVRGHIAKLGTEAGKVAERLRDARDKAGRHLNELADAAGHAGVTDIADLTPADGPSDAGAASEGGHIAGGFGGSGASPRESPASPRESLALARARVTARRGDVETVRGHLALLAGAEAKRKRAETAAEEADRAVTAGEEELSAAQDRLDRSRHAAKDALTRWTQRWVVAANPAAATADGPCVAAVGGAGGAPVGEAAGGGAGGAPVGEAAGGGAGGAPVGEAAGGGAAGALVGGVAFGGAAGPSAGEVAVVSAGDLAALEETLGAIGEAGARRLPEVFGELTEERRAAVIEARAHVAAEEARVATLLRELRAEREAVAAERDDAPPANDLRTAVRDGRPGAPLWRLVRFADGVDERDAAGIEGALYGAGLLTAWIHPDPELTVAALSEGEADGYLVPLPEERRPQGQTLAGILVAERQGMVPAEVIEAILRSIALDDAHARVPARVPVGRPGDDAGADAGSGERSDLASGPHPGVGSDLAVGSPAGGLEGGVGSDAAEGSGAGVGSGGAVGSPAGGLEGGVGSDAAEGSGAGGGSGLAGGLDLGVGRGGWFGVGPYVGGRPKAAVEYIGATNRAARRLVRIAEYDRLITAHVETQKGLGEESQRLNGLVADFGRARKELPETGPIVTAAGGVADRATRLAVARARLAETAKHVDSAVAEVGAAARRLRQAAAELAMPRDPREVDAVAQALDDLTRAAEGLCAEREKIATAQGDLAEREETIERLSQEQAEGEMALGTREAAHAVLAERLETLERTFDADLKEVLRQITETEGLLARARTTRGEQELVATREREAEVLAGAELEHGREALAGAFLSMAGQIAEFVPYTQADLRPLAGVADPTPWPLEDRPRGPERAGEDVAELMLADPSPDPLEAVRATLPGDALAIIDAYDAATQGGRAVTDATLKNTLDRISNALRDFQAALEKCQEDYRLDWEPGAVLTVHVIDADGRGPVSAFARGVAERAEEQGVLLEDRERTVLEDELLTGLAQQIHSRVVAAKDLVRGMNADTRSKPMSSGTTIGIRWVQSDKIDDRQRAVAALLVRDTAALGNQGLVTLRGHLRQMIRDHRARNSRATYKEALAAVLDYRSWYTFELLMARRGEPEVRLTRAKHSQMSGGEKSASIHLPLFAAANALYSSGRASCPRVIALDEAFAGIDDNYKPELLGLTVQFGLDLFMTGHDLWCTYSTVPMIAHYDLLHDSELRTVSTILALWDGAQVFDADAGYAGNDELVKELLGFTPRRHAPPGSREDTLYTDDEDDLEEQEAMV